ncbi:MAG: hypothetical protein M1839_009471 [Geoglossum umbratile]|nr:MAG: hypothetical protein M1839_009471 [Geoglossum umbratile]
MLCRRCTLRASSTLQPQSSRKIAQPQFRFLSTATTTTPPPSSAQTNPPKKTSQPPQTPPLSSSTPPGTPLRGLNFLKNRAGAVALPDAEYPPWLWRLLDSAPAAKQATEQASGDLFSKSAKQRRSAAKALRRAAGNAPAVKPVPLHEQSVDLPGNEEGTAEGALEAVRGRAEVTRRAREGRRAGIKEANFLKGMR